MSVSWSDYGKYATDIFTDEAIEAINTQGSTNPSQPLFLYLAHLAVHSANTVKSQMIAWPQLIAIKVRSCNMYLIE